MIPFRMPSRLSLLALFAVVIGTGCQKDEVHSYRVPKEVTPAAPTDTAEASTPRLPTETAGLTWQAPSHWVEQDAGGVRRGSYLATDASGATADISIIAFPGDVGGLAANLNRWRTQVGLSSLPDAQVEASVEHQDTPFFHLDFVNYLGEANGVPTRVAGAIMSHGGESWFFKIMGPATAVDAELGAFRVFLQTVAPSR
jgi:hypothetical protein